MQTENVNLENSMTISYNGDLRRTLQSDYLDFYHSHGFHKFLLLFTPSYLATIITTEIIAHKQIKQRISCF